MDIPERPLSIMGRIEPAGLGNGRQVISVHGGEQEDTLCYGEAPSLEPNLAILVNGRQEGIYLSQVEESCAENSPVAG